MYKTPKTEVKSYMKMTDLIEENPALLLMMQHFNMDFMVDDYTVDILCQQYDVNPALFISVANLYNGLRPKKELVLTESDFLQIIQFLRNSHVYYRKYKYPEISAYITNLQKDSSTKELKLLEQFFNNYFEEVIEHLDYEDNVAFPYFTELINNRAMPCSKEYSAKEYYEHHSDIELKLTDLKNLLLKHIKISNSLNLRRKLLLSLFELEFDLYIHSLIEESILIPAGCRIEEDCK